MKRSLVTSASSFALAFALAVPLVACGGGSDPPKDASDPAAADKDKDKDASTGDPIADAQATIDGLQKSVDAILQPIKDSDALLTSLGTLAADLKAAKSKISASKVIVEIKKIPSGGTPALDTLKIKDNDPGKAIVQDRVDKTTALFASLKDLDSKAKDLVSQITDAAPKLAAAVAKALPKIEAKLKAPFGVSADDKAKAQADKDKLMAIKDGFTAKTAEWQKALTDAAAKASDLPKKFAALK